MEVLNYYPQVLQQFLEQSLNVVITLQNNDYVDIRFNMSVSKAFLFHEVKEYIYKHHFTQLLL